MKHSFKTGFSFGTTSAVITCIGLMAGMYSGTNSRAAVLGAVLTIAFADSMSDGLGIHISEEAENVHSRKTIWEATAATVFFKSAAALSFALPVIFLALKTALWTSLIWGFFLIAFFSFYIAEGGWIKRVKAAAEHLLIGGIVVTGSYYIGLWIAERFGSV